MTARKTITIQLDTPIIIHGGVATEVVLQEPSYDDYLAFGEPLQFLPIDGGRWMSTENDEVIRKYLAKCIIAPKDHLLLGQGGMKLAREVKSALLSFFRIGDEAAAEPLETSQKTLSGDAKDASQPAT